MKSTLTIIGLYNWDNTLFDTMQLPSGMVRDQIISNIMIECGELEILLPNATLFKGMLSSWSASRLHEWQKMKDALTTDYSPLHNYDRTEMHEETVSDNITDTSKQNQTAGGSDMVTDRTAAFNGESLTAQGDSKTDYGGTAETTGNNTRKEDLTRKNTIRAYGNIGVTTSQQMLESEIELRSKYNIYDIIAAEFRHKFCIEVY